MRPNVTTFEIIIIKSRILITLLETKNTLLSKNLLSLALSSCLFHRAQRWEEVESVACSDNLLLFSLQFFPLTSASGEVVAVINSNNQNKKRGRSFMSTHSFNTDTNQ